jgi:cell division protein FtsI (penicillin-binding protein 3)/stage V sporulation protein D (sporulation-specific penicillin-binding protein)
MGAALANRRIRLLAFLFAAVFAVALARAVWLQGVRAPSLEKLAVSQQRETVALPAHRGTIFDRLGVELALGEEAITVYANPKQIDDPRKVAEVVARELGLDEASVLAKLSDRTKGFVYVARQADPDRARELERQNIVGLGFYDEERRVYPQRKVASSVIGYAGVDNDGLAGVELSMDDALTGEDGEETVVRDPFGRMLDVVDTKPVRDGEDVTLTLDHRLQAQVEAVLRQTRAEYGAKGATAVVLDPKTGAILALAEAPGYDANRYAETPPERVRMRAVTDTFEPGSVFKLVTYAAALETGLVTPSTTFYLDDSIDVADRTIHELAPRDPQVFTVEQMLAQSSNVGTVTLALELGKRRLAQWIDRFGFGRKTGIDFPGESPGIKLPLNEWTGSTIGTVPLGQGIAVTDLQLAAAYGAIANDGVLVEPHLIEKVGGKQHASPEGRRVVSEKTARRMLQMLRAVVTEGTATEAQVPGYTVAGKTGTGQKPDPRGGYSDTRYVASFAGIVPASSPRLVILVSADEPKADIYGGTVAAPAFAEIAKFALQYLDVPPDAPSASDAG